MTPIAGRREAVAHIHPHFFMRKQSFLMLLPAGLASVALISAIAVPRTPEPPGLLDNANAVLGLRKSNLVRLNLPEQANRPLELIVPIEGRNVVLDLKPYSVRSANYQVMAENDDGDLIARPDSPIRTLRGMARGIPGSIVSASRLPEGLQAHIQLPDGENYWIEPIGKQIAGARAGDHVFYKHEDVLDQGGTCAATLVAEFVEGAADQSNPGTSSAEQLSVAEVACDADYEYFQNYGSTTNVSDRIESIINTVNVQYERDVAITHLVGTIIVRTNSSDPYTSSDSSTLLDQFRIHWENNHNNIPRDVAHLFTGRDLDGSTIGIAYLSVICNGSFAYGISQSDFTSNFACVTDLTAHELGHNWGADHCSCSGFTMNPSITCANQFNATDTIPQIESFRDSRSCLDQTSPTPPEAPTNLNANTVSESAIDIDWTDNSSIEQGFEIERSDDGVNWAPLATVGANTVSFRDSGLPSSTTFFYQVNAFNSAGSSAFSNVASASTSAPPPPPAPPSNLVATAASESQINLNWTDNALTETGFEIERLEGASWISLGTTGADTTSFNDTGLNASTSYTYRVFAFNNGGYSSSSNQASATTNDPPPFRDHTASSEVFVSGSVTGTYQDTHVDDSSTQTIRERESGGKRQNRYSFLEHVWVFNNLVPGEAMTLFANAWIDGGSSDGDDFLFEYSTNGSDYLPVLTVTSTSTTNTQSGFLPTSISGTLYIRVVDSDRTSGNRSRDMIVVDHLYVRTDLVPGLPPAAPTGLVATAFEDLVQLNWVDESDSEFGFEIERSDDGGSNWAQIDSVSTNTTSFDDLDVLPSSTYEYRVRAFNGSGFSAYSNQASATTPAPGSLTLIEANGYKIKGKQHADLTWSGGSTATVAIYRDGTFIEETANDGAYTDNIGAKGGGSYTYEICEPGGGACSNTLQVTF